MPPAPSSTLFPYTTLFRSLSDDVRRQPLRAIVSGCCHSGAHLLAIGWDPTPSTTGLDRKSTRLNSSHGSISYAVFCLKKNTRVPVAAARRMVAPEQAIHGV